MLCGLPRRRGSTGYSVRSLCAVMAAPNARRGLVVSIDASYSRGPGLKFRPGEVEVKLGEFPQPFSSESFAFPSPLEKPKD
jgi:hypothetical protein